MTRRLTRTEIGSLVAAAVLAAIAGGSDLAGAPNTLQFLLAALALLMLAWIVGISTEQLGESAGPRVGGVLNATFGNAAELIITMFAISAGEIDVARAAITGSILGNTLLVLGLSFLVGGLRNGVQSFDRRLAGMNASMLALAVIGLGIPTAFAAVATSDAHVQAISDMTAFILLACYVLSLIFTFQLPMAGREGVTEHSRPHLPARVAIVMLVCSTRGGGGDLRRVRGDSGRGDHDAGDLGRFLGLVIVPLVGNIAENIVGIKIAWQNQMDFSMVVSLGSSLQVALGVAPLLVFLLAVHSPRFQPRLSDHPDPLVGCCGYDHCIDRARW